MLLDARDTISGKSGKAFATINGQVFELFYLKNLESNIEKQKAEVKVLGSRFTHYKTTGLNGTGSFTLYYVTSKFRNLITQYLRTGKDVYFDIQVVNEDKESSTGKQTIVLKDCNIDSQILAKLDSESEDAMDEDVDFTFEGFEILNNFTDISV